MKFSFFLKISILVIAFGLVIYFMRALKTTSSEQGAADPNSVISLLAGSEFRFLNWCPEKLTKIEIYSETGVVIKTLTSKQDFAAVCELMVGGFIRDPSRPLHFKIKLRAISESVSPVFLEMDSTAKIFQVKGMPFSSPGLIKALDRLTAP